MDERFYERYAQLEDAHWWFRARRRIIAATLERHVPQLAGGRVLDVGCGTGATLAELLAPAAREAVGVDGEALAVAAARRRGVDVRHVEGLPEVPLPFDDATFDVVCAFDVLEHLADDRALLAEMRRVLAPGGAIVVTVPAFPALWGQQDVISHHHRRYTRRTLARLLDAAALERRHMTFFNTALFPAVAAIRLVRRPRLARAGADAAGTDFDTGPSGALAGRVLERVMGAEAPVAAGAGLPFGVSLLAVAAQPA